MRALLQRNMTSRESLLQSSRLFVALEYGEQLASHCAQQQACLFSSVRHRRFLRSQARQEAFHAQFFKRAAQYIDTGRQFHVPKTLRAFAVRLEDALRRRDVIETLVGQQIVLESFGATILEHLNRGMDNQGIGLRRLRRSILAQEQAHHAFGEKVLQQQCRNGSAKIDRLQSLAGEYLGLVDDILVEMSDVFYCLDENPANYKAGMLSSLPDWFKGVSR